MGARRRRSPPRLAPTCRSSQHQGNSQSHSAFMIEPARFRQRLKLTREKRCHSRIFNAVYCLLLRQASKRP
eukprot:2582442-Pleurochrysis_carterae.AAC.9